MEVFANTLPTGVSNTSKSLSFDEIKSKDLEKIVKSAVVDTFNKKRNNDQNKSYVAIYGMPEDGCDYYDVADMLAYLRCESCVFGRERRSSDQGKPRPLKVELLSAAGRDYVLKMSLLLNKDAYWASVIVSLWLQRDELVKMNVLKQRCWQLNSGTQPVNG